VVVVKPFHCTSLSPLKMNSLKMMIDDERIAMVCQCESNDTASEEVSRKYKITEIGNCMVAQESPHHDKAKQGEKIRRHRSLAVPSGCSPKIGGGQSSAALEWLQPSHD